MKRAELALHLAHSLTLGTWDLPALHHQLRRRLPAALHDMIADLAADLWVELPCPYAPSAARVAQALGQGLWFQQLYDECQRRAVWPAPDLSAPAMAPVSALSGLDIPQLPRVGDLADWLMLPLARLDYLADRTERFEQHGETAINHYHYMLKPKKSGGQRVIEAPKETLKTVQRQILAGIIDHLPPHDDAFGFVKGRSCLDAANRHAGEEVVVCFDLRDFFPSIGAGRVFGLFRSLGYPHNVARSLTALCTTATPPRILQRLAPVERAIYRSPHLPQGAPSSPALANHVAFGLDRRLHELARRLDAQYSRYADDLTFSGDRACAASLLRAVPQIICEEGFALNLAKTRVMPATGRQVVTGLVVNRHLNIDRRSFDQMKAILHACAKPDDRRLADPAFCAHLSGRVGWIETVNPARGRKLRVMFERALRAKGGSA